MVRKKSGGRMDGWMGGSKSLFKNCISNQKEKKKCIGMATLKKIIQRMSY